MAEERHAAEDHGKGNIHIPPDGVPDRAALASRSGVDGGEKLVLFHHIEPRDRAECRADGDDVNGHEIHPRAPF